MALSDALHYLQGWMSLAKGLLDVRRYWQRQSDVELSAFSSLPVELVLRIVELLDASDAACVALCDRALYRAVGSAPRDLIRWGRDKASPVAYVSRCSLLSRISKDHPDLFLCHFCTSLHRIAAVLPPAGPEFVWHPTGNYWGARHLQCGSRPIWWGMSTYMLTFAHVQLATYRFRCGLPYGIPLCSLSQTLVRHSKRYHVTTLTSVSARIVSEELCLRVQYWVSLAGHADLTVLHDEDLGNICGHFKTLSRTESAKPARHLVDCKTNHQTGRADCATCHPLLRCTECGIELQVEIRRFGDCTAVVWTKWLTLGRGEHPDDPKWKQHRSFTSRQVCPLTRASATHRLRDAFESTDGQSLAELTQDNEAILEERLYRGFEEKGFHIEATFRGSEMENYMRCY